ncbi:NlpC/P60 family protein [Bradyrhizobium sp. SSUT112]|uniref:C40 family peptidase n=1 Tax=Bradyrhizobium sp. SSUT112 TaxID=3040604 RepID=UPI00244B737C|nr:NlpC/P60 family protein [Bradyrhizobium sp. SSUT112]MDH2352056.1 NlpC/P60 family protein [Bradyrhizobium sp. SSUT112]
MHDQGQDPRHDPRHDPRLTPARSDLAAKYLEGKVQADRFVTGEEFEVFEAIAPVREQPSSNAMLMTQALRGERITVYDRNGEGWAWGQLSGDGYVGWLPDAALMKPSAPPTHMVSALRTFAFPGPSIKLPPEDTLVMGSKIAVAREDGSFAVTRDGQYLPKAHLAPLGHREPDFVTVAERFVGTPYLWGGKSSLGIDCSGLVQVSLISAGTGCPRDSDMQQAGLGRALEPGELSKLQRGDLIFWKGHVAIVRDGATMVHANAHHMATVIEPVEPAIARIKQAGSEVAAIKRL